MNKTFWIFGDSWAWGWAKSDKTGVPKQYEERYSLLFAKELGYSNIVDLSDYGRSFGQICEDFLKNSNEIKKGDIVFVTIPPDSRGYVASESGHESFNTLFYSSKNYKKLLELQNYNLYYFKYHLSLFITTITDICNRIGCDCIMQHNYGKLDLTEWCNTSSILDLNNSMWNWLGLDDAYDISMFETSDGPSFKNIKEPREVRRKYIEKLIVLDNGDIDFHPNETSHKLITKKLVSLYKKSAI